MTRRVTFIVWLMSPILASAADVDYLRDVKPLLTAKCFSCHGALRQKSGLRLDTLELMKKGGKAGPAVVAGKSDESVLIEAITGDGRSRMPPKDQGEPLTPEQIATIRKWIDQGAKGPVETAAADPRQHWSFKPVVRPAPPTVGHPIDAFLSAARDREGLKARPEADRRTLIRRVYFDLIGLPPTPQQVETFLNDSSLNAYERVVDQLLASPQYGERWGRHWMDVWRYSDWDGHGAEVRNSQPHIWRWRDWIVESLNVDAGYDEMVRQMLAGDEIAPTDPNTLRATGFLVRNWYKFNRNVWLESTVEHTSKAFLGLTMNCCRCHDHMYDPLSQVEYFRFRAIFEPHDIRTDRVPGQPDAGKDGLVRVFDAKLDAPTYRFERGDEKHPDESKKLAPGLPEVFGADDWKPTSIELPATAQRPNQRGFVVRETRADLEAHLSKARMVHDSWTAKQKLAKSVAHLTSGALYELAGVEKWPAAGRLAELELQLAEARLAAEVALVEVEALEVLHSSQKSKWADVAKRVQELQRTVAVLAAKRDLTAGTKAEVEAEAAVNKVNAKAIIKKATEALAKAEAESKKPLTTAYAPRPGPVYPTTTSGRRLALARWITDAQNPLTARVATNHIWMRHFGKPLVRTTFDFGRNGTSPTHPELLDWLASELIRLNWKMKPFHRLLVTSAAYRQSSTPDSESLARDPDNKWLWRFSPRRVEAEVVRDSILAVTGKLDHAMGGPDLPPEQGLTVTRRSIYFRHSIEKYVGMLKAFDSANVAECYRRDESIVPQQALALANNPLVLSQARVLASQLNGKYPDPVEFVAAAFQRLLGRPPRPEESSECVEFLRQQTVRLTNNNELTRFASGPNIGVKASTDPARRARESLIQVLMNHHEFVTIR